MSQQDLPELVCVGEAIIRQCSQPVTNIDLGKHCCNVLAAKLKELKGAGLAAPQLGMPWRVFVVEVHKNEYFPDRDTSPLFELINPQLRVIGDQTQTDWEACFSVPGMAGRVERARVVEMSYQTPDGEHRQQIFENYLARVMQHEMDHLNGMIYLDRMPDMSTISTRDNYLKTLKARA